MCANLRVIHETAQVHAQALAYSHAETLALCYIEVKNNFINDRKSFIINMG